MCGALPLPAGDGDVPEWIHLLPAGEIETNDGRGPYRVPNPARLIALSMSDDARLPVDENHSIDLAAPNGEASPARGWIVEMQPRSDGIWGKVEWNGSGKALLSDKAYRNISPVIVHDAKGNILGVLRASLVNRPNLRGLTALHQERSMDFLAQLRKLLGLPETADEAAVVASVTELHAAKDTVSPAALQAALAPIAKAAGAADGADSAAIVTAIQAMGDTTNMVPKATVTALQAELTAVSKDLKELRETGARDRATAFVDGAIKAQKVGVKPLRDHYIARHMVDPAAVEKEIGAFPALHASGATIVPPGDVRPGELAPDEAAVVAMMGIDPEAFKKTKAAQAAKQEAL
ncbi:hypothetical protein BA190_27585 [Labrys sp. WJW]|nr:hypothetical protein BA190_27585 [Labrys sp. WJW]